MLADWSVVRRFCRETADELAKAYALVDILGAIPLEVREAWLQEDTEVTKGV